MDKAYVYSKSLVFDGTAMTGTGALTSRVLDVRMLTNVGLFLIWTGTPTGAFQVQTSLDFVPGGGMGSGEAGLIAPKVAGNWVDMLSGAVSSLSQPAGAAGSRAVWFQNIPFPWLRVVYTNAAGVGVLGSCYLAGKGW